jgi:hypothetical protein
VAHAFLAVQVSEEPEDADAPVKSAFVKLLENEPKFR